MTERRLYYQPMPFADERRHPTSIERRVKDDKDDHADYATWMDAHNIREDRRRENRKMMTINNAPVTDGC